MKAPMNVNANKALQPSFTMSMSSQFFKIASFNCFVSLFIYTNQSKLFLARTEITSLHGGFILELQGS